MTTRITFDPLDDPAVDTIARCGAALEFMLASTVSRALDAGQVEMVEECVRRLDQIESELS